VFVAIRDPKNLDQRFQGVKCREDLAVRKVARGAEEDERVGSRLAVAHFCSLQADRTNAR
jgi:hypothetical protein